MNIDMFVSEQVNPESLVKYSRSSGMEGVVVVGRDYSDTLQFQIRGREQGFLVLGGVQYGCRDQGSLLVYGVSEASGLKKIGGSGAESCECIGRAYTFFENHINSISDLVQELRQGSYFASDHLYSAPRKYTEATLSLSQKSIPADIKENGERT